MLDTGMTNISAEAHRGALTRCGVSAHDVGSRTSASPITGEVISHWDPQKDPATATSLSVDLFTKWRDVPAQTRGRVLLRFSELLIEHREDLATLITAEAGKVPKESRGEVDEIVEMCHLAIGLSHQLYGRTLPSSRPNFRLMETFHPIGPIAVITPFSFPAASWGWSAPLALVCGNPVLWKPSPQAPMTARALVALLDRAAGEFDLPSGLCQVLLGDEDAATALANDPRVPVVNISGRSSTGQALGPIVTKRFGRALMHLGGNNASVITPSGDLDDAVAGIVLAATSAAGQRCSSMRRLIVHTSIADEVAARVASAFNELKVADPRDQGTDVGPLIDRRAFDAMTSAMDEAKAAGGQILAGGERVDEPNYPHAFYMRPALVEMPSQSPIVETETLAPILYLLRYSDLSEAIALNNSVVHGFSSSIYSRNQGEIEAFLRGSDCGIVNINLHTSGAEVGTAFGGEKATGGGRQCGTDAWQSYMRRVTTAVQ